MSTLLLYTDCLCSSSTSTSKSNLLSQRKVLFPQSTTGNFAFRQSFLGFSNAATEVLNLELTSKSDGSTDVGPNHSRQACRIKLGDYFVGLKKRLTYASYHCF